MEIQFARDKEYHGAHGMNAVVATRAAFGRLEQTIEGFEEAIGLPSLRPSHDAVEVSADHFGHFLHRLNFGAHDIGTPLRQQVRYDIDLLALKNLSQLLAVQPGACGTFGRDMRDQRIQVGALSRRQVAPVLEQSPAQAFQVGIGLLLGTAHLVHGGRGMRDDVEFIECNAGIGQVIGDTLDESRRHVDADTSDLAGIAAMASQVLGKRFDGLGITSLGDEDDLARYRIGDQGQIVMTAPTGSLVNGNGANAGQISGINGQVDILGANGVYAMPGFAHDPRYRGERHLPGQHQHQRLEQQGEAGQLARPVRFDQGDLPVRQPDARHADLEVALMLEKVQVPVTLDLRVVNRMGALDTGISEAATRHEIDVDGQTLLSGIEVNALDKPGIDNTQSGFKDLVLHRRSLTTTGGRNHVASAVRYEGLYPLEF